MDMKAPSFVNQLTVTTPPVAYKTMNEVKSIIIADRYALTRAGIVATLSEIAHFTIVAETADFVTTMRQIDKQRPNVLLFEPGVLGRNPMDISHELNRIAPTTKQVAILDERDRCCELTRGMPLAGGLMKTDDLVTLCEILNKVIEGAPAFSDAYFAAANSRKPCESLTDRERQIMAAILSGSTSRDIGGRLGISIKTVENHRTNLMRKLGVHSVATLSQWARSNQCIYGAG